MMLSQWTARPRPGQKVLSGRIVELSPLTRPEQYAQLFDCVGRAEHAALWTYMPLGPFESQTQFTAHLKHCQKTLGWEMMVIANAASPGSVLGMAGFMRIREAHGSVEVGCVTFSPKLQRSTAATEAMYLMARHVFDDLGYRRYEWKCHNDNAASRRAAERLGFVFEGVFRQDMVVKGSNRDTAWFSMIDQEWPALRAGFESWLAPENFTDKGQQRHALEACRR